MNQNLRPFSASESLKELASAFAKAQAEIEGATADKQNPHFRSRYADLGNVVDAIKPAITKHGLSFVQVSHNDESAACIETIILHSSGEWLSCGCVSVPVSKHDAQGYGSALTYARRYSLAAAFGVAPEDDDGNAAAKNAPPKHEPSFAPLSEQQVVEIAALADEVGVSLDKILAFCKARTFGEVPATAYHRIINKLEQSRKAAA
jgi:hypothetical protein